MNERLKELAEQAGLQNTLGCFWQSSDDAIERFADLVSQNERDACAALCELQWERDDCAAAIRARGEK